MSINIAANFTSRLTLLRTRTVTPAGQRAVDMAAQLGADALILADLAMLEYAAERYPHIERHVSVQASATNEEAIHFYHRHFDVARVVLPRVLSIHQVKQLARVTPVPLEVFAFGSLCIMSEGRGLSVVVSDG